MNDWDQWLGGQQKHEQKSLFLNAFLVAMADHKLEPAEAAVLKAIQKRLGLSDQEVKQILANPADITFTPPKTPQERFSHLVDLVFLMLIDGNIDPAEARLVVNFATLLGFKPAVVPALVQRIAQDIKAQKSRSSIIVGISSSA